MLHVSRGRATWQQHHHNVGYNDDDDDADDGAADGVADVASWWPFVVANCVKAAWPAIETWHIFASFWGHQQQQKLELCMNHRQASTHTHTHTCQTHAHCKLLPQYYEYYLQRASDNARQTRSQLGQVNEAIENVFSFSATLGHDPCGKQKPQPYPLPCSNS